MEDASAPAVARLSSGFATAEMAPVVGSATWRVVVRGPT